MRPSAGIHISRIFHAGYVLAAADTRVVFDPIVEVPFSVNCYPYPRVRIDLEELQRERFDAIFISHFHDDHCSLESLQWFDRNTPVYLYCLEPSLGEWIRDMGFVQVHALMLDASVTIGPFVVTPRRALDEDVDAMFDIAVAELRILNVVDAMMHPDTLALLAARAPWDLVIWPFQTMQERAVISPSRAAPADTAVAQDVLQDLAALHPRYVVPGACQFIHEPWSWYRHAFFPISYARFSADVTAFLPGVEVVRFAPGSSWRLDRHDLVPDGALSWVIPDEPQDVDYVYDPTMTVPTTAAIARCLPALSDEKQNQVDVFCRETLPVLYAALDPPDTGYFDTPRHWRLVLAEADGRLTCLQFEVSADRLQWVTSSDRPLGWLTEIPAVKIWGAAFEGESLSSLYIRINDQCFSPAIEAALPEADLLDDPLLRCLYNHDFAPYQRAQRQRLKKVSE